MDRETTGGTSGCRGGHAGTVPGRAVSAAIPVQVGRGREEGDLDTALSALLGELDASLFDLTETGRTHTVDLRRSPLSARERDQLRELLGCGETRATLDLLGPTEIEETAVPGLWWVVHRTVGGHVVSEFIEVTRCPELLACPDCELRGARQRLARRVSGRARQAVDAPAVTRSLLALGLREDALAAGTGGRRAAGEQPA